MDVRIFIKFFLFVVTLKYLLFILINLYIDIIRYDNKVDRAAAYRPNFLTKNKWLVIFIKAAVIEVFAISLVFLLATYITPTKLTIILRNEAIINMGTKLYPSINFLFIINGYIIGIRDINISEMLENMFIVVLNILLKYSFISLSFMCNDIDSVRLMLNILYIVIYTAENLFAADSIPVLDNPRIADTIILSDELNIHQDI